MRIINEKKFKKSPSGGQICFDGCWVTCDPSTFWINRQISGRPVAECKATIFSGKDKGKQVTVIGMAAYVGCRK